MKKIFCLLLIVLPLISSAQNINVIYALRTYHSSSADYAEINTSVEASSLNTVRTNSGKYRKSAEFTVIICSTDAPDSAIYVEKRVINSPEVADSSSLNNVALLDMQRTALRNGDYVVYFEIKDADSDMPPMRYRDVIRMNYPQNEINVSDIMLVESYEKSSKNTVYTKSGFEMKPYMPDVIPQTMDVITYYAEIYNADKEFGENTMYAVVTAVEDLTTGKKVGDIQTIKRQKAQNITSVLGSLNVSQLTEGSYYLTVEVRNGNNILYAYKRYPFYKQSDKKKEINFSEVPENAFVNNMDDSTLKENIRCLRPVASKSQTDYILKTLKTSSVAEDRYFLYQYYAEKNAAHPETAWAEYMRKINLVNEKYSTPIKKGYDTDMGRVLLLYGEPNTIIDEKFGASSGFDIRTDADKVMNVESPPMDPRGVSYYPYQIWVYEHTPFGESNRKFVFYAKQNNLAEYFLLHSNARGELQDLYWENVLSHGTLDQGVVGKAGKQFQRGHQ
ncbi:MAG: GWxTD domain-containing protein [Bacteroidales bacterium]|nr:GWxTD domain-containing protein [Bacteroidales bacterium]